MVLGFELRTFTVRIRCDPVICLIK